MEVSLTGVYYVPEMEYNLLSIGILEEIGCYCTIRNGCFDVIDGSDDEVVFSGTRVDKSYILDLDYAQRPRAMRSSTKPPANHASWDLWHRRLGHLNMQDVKRLANMSEGINSDKANELQKKEQPYDLCISCSIGKKTKIPSRVPRRQNLLKRATRKGELVHSDLAGGGKIKRTKGGHKYVASMICDKTDMLHTFFLKKKSELPHKLREYFTMMKTQGNPVERLSSDNESIYAGAPCQAILKEFGIQ